MSRPVRQPGRQRGRAWRVGLVVGVVLGLVPLAAGARIGLPGWATPWSATTTNGTSTLTVGTWLTYVNTVKAEASVQLYYRMGDSSGNLVPSAGYVQAGPSTGGATYGQAGAITDGNTSILFNGGQSFDYGNQMWFSGTAAFSVELWFKPSGTLASGQRRLVEKLDAGSNGWDVGYYGSDAGGNAGKAYCGRTASSSAAVAMSTSAMASGTWYHLVCTYDGSTLRTYVNGSLNTSASSTGSMGTSTANGSIGSLHLTAGSYAIGYIDEVAFYGAALSGTAVAAHYAAR